MENLVFIVLFLCGIFGCGWFIIRIVEWQSKLKKFPSNKAAFISDLFKLQNKWMKKGEFDYAQSIQLIITSWNLPDSKQEAQTLEGLEMQDKMRNYKAPNLDNA
jgi:hypothetical protein